MTTYMYLLACTVLLLPVLWNFFRVTNALTLVFLVWLFLLAIVHWSVWVDSSFVCLV